MVNPELKMVNIGSGGYSSTDGARIVHFVHDKGVSRKFLRLEFQIFCIDRNL
jgi:hypothetical protein